MKEPYKVVDQVAGLYRIVTLPVLRRTPGVAFDIVPVNAIVSIDAVDRLIHDKGAFSPGAVGKVARPWYMHPCQDDHLLVLHGYRDVEIYTKEHGRIEQFRISAQAVEKGGRVVHEGGALLVWPRWVFHRIGSSEKEGSISLNFARHHEGFDIRTNFNIYDLDTTTGKYKMIREGYLDQPDLT